MQYVIRFIGIALIVGLAVLSASNFQERLDTIQETGATKAVSLPDTELGSEEDIELAAGTAAIDVVPEYLAFGEPIRAGIYDIAELPDSDDRDVRESTDDEDFSYPVETDLDPNSTLTNAGELTPGLYATAFGVSDCSFELRSIMRTKQEAIIGKDRLDHGRMLVSINEIEPDTFVSVPQCGDWFPWAPLAEPLTVVGDGDYWIGDLKRGTWDVPDGCMWEKVVGFRGAKLWDVQDSGHGPEPLVVDSETLGVRIRGCSTSFRHQSVS